MKSNKVLLGLFVGVLALTVGSAKAQEVVDRPFVEIGPANVGGHVSSLVIDNADPTHSTIFAGATTGGLFVRSSNSEMLQRIYSDMTDQSRAESLSKISDSWHLVRYYDETRQELVLPINAMTQSADGMLFLGTGSDDYAFGTTYTKMSPRGRGIYRYNPSKNTFAAIPSTVDNDNFTAVHALGVITRDGYTYLFAATPAGLYRWKVKDTEDDSEWNSTPHRVQSGNIDQLLVISSLNVAYFTIGNQLYRISDLTKSDGAVTAQNISASCKAFGGINTRLKLAVSPSDPHYVYAMVCDQNGLLENAYVTTNGQNWSGITTSSVVPMLFYTRRNENNKIDTVAYNTGRLCGAVAVDPSNPKRVILAGTNMWVGEGFLAGANYTWTKNSYSEYELNYGNYTNNVFNTSYFVHSGIQHIVSAYNNEMGKYGITYYIATDAGVFAADSSLNIFSNINRGLNNVQINAIDVAPDGSVISGANSNGAPFIESRAAHNGGKLVTSWYDNGELGNMNHDANVLWRGNGGAVAASSFQQIKTQTHRNIFVSSAGGAFGRAWTDYLDYTNSTAWTTNSRFLTEEVKGGPEIGKLYLWENDQDSILMDSISVKMDLMGDFYRANGDTVHIDGDTTLRVRVGDRVVFQNRANSDYPFEHVFEQKDANKKVNSTFFVKTPNVARMMIIANIPGNQTAVMFSWMPNDFSSIYDSVVQKANDSEMDPQVKDSLKRKFMYWAPIFSITHSKIAGTEHIFPRCMAMSPDGKHAYISTYDTLTHASALYRIDGFEKVDYTLDPATVKTRLSTNSAAILRDLNTTLLKEFERPISHIAVDPREGMNTILLTFEDYVSDDNIVVVQNVNDDEPSFVAQSTNNNGELPVYCAIIERESGNYYIGTADGVYILDNSSNSWKQHAEMRGLPVTSIVQQVKNYQVKRAVGHTGPTAENYLYAKTKWPGAIYFGTYGRGVFMDMEHVTDMENEISDSSDYTPVAIPIVDGNGRNSISIFPNPVSDRANLQLNAVEAGEVMLVVYDLNGRTVSQRSLGFVAEGAHTFSISTDGMSKGMYLVNVIISGHTAATKMMVR